MASFSVNLLAGDDALDGSALSGGIIALIGDGGIDDDVLIGSAGSDKLRRSVVPRP